MVPWKSRKEGTTPNHSLLGPVECSTGQKGSYFYLRFSARSTAAMISGTSRPYFFSN
jgi:hypothetical protein